MHEPARPRFFSVMGWIFILFGMWFPIRTLIDLYSAWKALSAYDMFWEQRWPFMVVLVETLLASALDAGVGWGLLKRRSWALPVASFAGGLMVTVACRLVYRLRGDFVFGLDPSGPPQPAVDIHQVVTRVLHLVPVLAHAICWMILLGAIFRRNGRIQFPPRRTEFTPARYWIAVAAGALSFLLYLWVLA